MTEVAILGAGFSGIGMAVRLLQAGVDDIVVLERGSDVGGTWRDNTYPGAACDIPSDLYSFSFAPNPDWTRIFPPQREIQAYLRGVADRFGVTPNIRFGTELERADWDETARMWRLSVRADAGGGGARAGLSEIEARVFVSASGPFVDPTWPAIPGLESFAGARFHSARWDHGIDPAGTRVAVIGTGASAIQFVPELRKVAAHVDVFQRSAPWIMPRLDRGTSRLRRAAFRRLPVLQRISRGFTFRTYELRWPVFANRVIGAVGGFGLGLLRRLALRDRELDRRATPHYRVGCKRILISDDWYPAIRSANVELVTDAITRIEPDAVVTADGVCHPVDVLICATGFSVTAPVIASRIHGRDGRTLAEVWKPHASALKGTAVAGFPNLFQLLGPNTTLAHNSMIGMIEAQIGYVLQAITGAAPVLEARPEAVAAYDAKIQDAMGSVVWTTGGCASYYFDAEGRNTAAWPHGAARFARELRHFDEAEYVRA
jgi:cation diffusion facilitator CzcD-associated flavoprotein CzcO